MQDNNQIKNKLTNWWYVAGVIAILLNYYLIFIFLPLDVMDHVNLFLYSVPVFWGLIFYLVGSYKKWSNPAYKALLLIGLVIAIIVALLALALLVGIILFGIGVGKSVINGGPLIIGL